MLSTEHTKLVCKMGQMADCCKYLVIGPEGFECAKHQPSIKGQIDRKPDMNAKGDNCAGIVMGKIVDDTVH